MKIRMRVHLMTPYGAILNFYEIPAGERVMALLNFALKLMETHKKLARRWFPRF